MRVSDRMVQSSLHHFEKYFKFHEKDRVCRW